MMINTSHFIIENFRTLVLSILPILFAIIGVAFCIVFYIALLRQRTALQKKLAEQVAQDQYVRQIEMQQSLIRKFKHDYQNILLSINGFIMEDDFDGLKRYMPKVNAASTIVISDDTFTLENLGKIKCPEIKILLTEKLIYAQNISADISVTIDVYEEINHIPADSVILVRMLGTILDNAVEALMELQSGKLSVACYKDKSSVVFVVQNTCLPNLPPYSQLRQQGFSTKANGRGLGLSNLSELLNLHPETALQSNISGGNFTQKILIGE
ncbi:MAG: GHKL domain-containing protein [Oscillospiraceae bacterium]|nr:GHKL domain-containing protein [Oscillospiraceae bacterium]